MPLELEGEDKHDHTHEVDEDFDLMESNLAPNEDEVSHKDIAVPV